MSNEDASIKIIARNRKAFYDYEILETFEAGIMLQGTEVKSLRDGHVALADGFGNFRGDELYIVDLDIPQYSHGNINNHDPHRPRKLLVHRRELIKIRARVLERGLTMVPLKLYFKRGWAKVEMAIVRGKTRYDKRDSIRDREVDREIRRHSGRQGK
ncbi:MAG: SsrA-binding protein SmpB [Candidatus Brocadiia bacterium]